MHIKLFKSSYSNISASSSREMLTSLKEVGYLGTKIIIQDGKILVVKPEPKLVKLVRQLSKKLQINKL